MRGRREVPGLRAFDSDHPSAAKTAFAFTAPLGLGNPMTRAHVRLLGPCFKTGRRRHRPTRNRYGARTRDVLAIRVPSLTRRVRSQECGAPDRNPELHPHPRSGPSGSSREPAEKCCHSPEQRPRRVLADPVHDIAPNSSLNLRGRLRERLRLPLHSFTYS